MAEDESLLEKIGEERNNPSHNTMGRNKVQRNLCITVSKPLDVPKMRDFSCINTFVH
jgi:hypothetical protein